jgi:hypothetical protein
MKIGLSEGFLRKQHLFQFPVPVYTKIWTGGHATVRGERYKTGRAKEFVFEWWEETLQERRIWWWKSKKNLPAAPCAPHPFVCSTHTLGASATLAVPHWLACIRIKMV